MCTKCTQKKLFILICLSYSPTHCPLPCSLSSCLIAYSTCSSVSCAHLLLTCPLLNNLLLTSLLTFLLPDCLFHLLIFLLHTPPTYLPRTLQSTAHLPAHFPIAGLLIPPARLSPAYTSCLPAPYSPIHCSLTCSLSYCRIAYSTCSSFSCVHLLLTCPLLTNLLFISLLLFLLFDCLFHLLVFLLRTPPAYLPPTHKSTFHFFAHFPMARILIPPAHLSPLHTSCLPAPYSPTYCSVPCLLSYWLIAYSTCSFLLRTPPAYLPPTHQPTAHFPAHFPIAGLLIPPAHSPTYCSLTCSLSYCRIAYSTCSSFSCEHLLLSWPLLTNLLLIFLLLSSCLIAYSTCSAFSSVHLLLTCPLLNNLLLISLLLFLLFDCLFHLLIFLLCTPPAYLPPTQQPTAQFPAHFPPV
jgi:hypothetical protein